MVYFFGGGQATLRQLGQNRGLPVPHAMSRGVDRMLGVSVAIAVMGERTGVKQSLRPKAVAVSSVSLAM
jgi:hypothetical protein